MFVIASRSTAVLTIYVHTLDFAGKSLVLEDSVLSLQDSLDID